MNVRFANVSAEACSQGGMSRDVRGNAWIQGRLRTEKGPSGHDGKAKISKRKRHWPLGG